MILKNEPIFSSSFELALFRRRPWWLERQLASAAAVESGEGVCPGGVASKASRRCQAEIPSWLPFGVMVLKRRVPFPARELHPLKPLEVGEINHEGVIAAATHPVGSAGEVSLSELVNYLRGNGALLPPRLPLFVPGSPVKGVCPEKSPLVVIEDVRLGSAHAGVYPR